MAKGLEKLGKARTGAWDNACLRAAKDWSWAAVQMKQVFFLRRSVNGLLIIP
jgi:hypothetical protein